MKSDPDEVSHRLVNFICHAAAHAAAIPVQQGGASMVSTHRVDAPCHKENE
jgi:hypothetical protein